MLNIALFGAPGAGKGTQSKLLMEKYDLVYIATGDILRREIAEGGDLGLQAKAIIDKGGLVPDEIVAGIIEKVIASNRDCGGFLFDGFPRTYVQAYILEGLLLKQHTSLTALISLDVDHEVSTARLLARAETSGRSDDNDTVIRQRLEEYDSKTAPVAGFYREKGIHIPIDGIGTIEEVYQRVETAVEAELRKVLFNVVLLGYPGSGRRTQALKLAERYNLAYLSTGEMLQHEIDSGSAIGREVAPVMQRGEHVPDEIVIRLLEKHIHRNPDVNGFIFKGFPRTVVQAYILDGLLLKIGSKVSFVTNIELPTLELIKRLNARGKTDQRMSYDQDAETIVQRLEEHERKSGPVTDYYSRYQRIAVIDGNGDEDQVHQRIAEPLQVAMRRVR